MTTIKSKNTTVSSYSLPLKLLFACIVFAQATPTYACMMPRVAPQSPAAKAASMAATIKMMNNRNPTVITSPNGLHFLKLMPSKWVLKNGAIIKAKEAYALAFKVTLSGQFQQAWSYKNWDKETTGAMPELYLSNDGKQLVEVNRSVKDTSTKNAVIFYRKGKVVKSYSALELAVDAKHIRVLPCHGTIYTWSNSNSNSNSNSSSEFDYIEIGTMSKALSWRVADGKLIKQ